jgi:membrane fusion protein (multidrug efflux system)
VRLFGRVLFSPRALFRLFALIAVPAAAIVGGGMWWLSGGRFVSTENAYVKAHIVQVSSEVAGQIRRVPARDHAEVRAGDTLLTIEQRPFKLALDSAEAELDAARVQVETLRATWREVKAELADAETRAAYFQRQLQRQEELAAKGVASASKRDEAQNDAQAAADRVSTAKQRLVRVLTALNGDPEMPAENHAAVRDKIAARERAALDLARTTVRAPVDGVVVNMRLQQGEQIKSSTPLFALVVTSRPWVEANFKETELTNVRVGQKATVVLDTYPDETWEALVESVSPATGAEFALLPPQNASGNWVKVVQRLPVKLRLLPHVGEPPLRAGMTATVKIDTERQRSLGGVAIDKPKEPPPPHDVTAQTK